MSLSELKFSNEKRPTPHWRSTPAERVRNAVLATITLQNALLEAERNDAPTHLTKTVKKADEHGNITDVTVERKPRKWFWKNPQGRYVVEMLYAGQPVLINGKQSTIEAGDADGVEKVLAILAQAVSNGDLDKALTDASAKRKVGRKKAA